MLSSRGKIAAASQHIPWRFAPGHSYDAVRNPDGVVSFALAENHLVREELHEYVKQNVSFPSLAYTYKFSTLGGPEFPLAMAAHLNTHFQPHTPVQASHIFTASALTAIHEMVAFSLANTGDGVLVSRPVYGRFELDFGNTCGLSIVYADSEGIDPFSLSIVEKYQTAIDEARGRGVSVRFVLIVNPHNPLGRCYPAETLKALMALCQRNAIHLVSDEVYALSVYDMGDAAQHGFTSVLSLDPADLIDEDRLHVFYGMSKDFAAAGLRLGCLITKNYELRQAVVSNARFHGPSGPSIAIGTAILQDSEFVARFSKLSQERLRDARQYTEKILDGAGVRYERGNAGFFTFINLSPWLPEGEDPDREYALAQALLDAGIGFHPREEHYQKPGHFRLVFSLPREVLEEGLRRLVKALKKISSQKVASS